jgi:septum formation protein
VLILASGSPRRIDLLKAAGLDFDVMPAKLDESVLAGESPTQHVKRLAEAKARDVLRTAIDPSTLPGADESGNSRLTVLGADTIVVVGAEILGKPADADDAVRMLRLLSGRAHEVLTGVAVVTSADIQVEVARTTVHFAPVTDAEMSWYVSTGEPFDKAGAYAIQGLASRFVESIHGSYSNVVGLPVALVYKLLRRYPEW